MNDFKVGFGRINITPMMGIFIEGYFIDRYADGVLDDLEANAIAFEFNGERALLISADLCGINMSIARSLSVAISKSTGVPADKILITATHTHTGPATDTEIDDPNIQKYIDILHMKLADVAAFAIEDLKPAKMGFGVGVAPNVAFVRRFVMKDGTIKTNPGVNNPDILRPVGTVDERVNVIRFDRENAETVLFVNFGNHPDVVGGTKISGDWPSLLRHTVEKTLDNVKCIFANGAQGDVNHVNVFPKGGYLNDMFMDFDDVSRGYAHSKYIARVVTGGVLQCFDKVEYTDVDSFECLIKTIKVPANIPSPEELPEAHRINDLHLAGRDSELPYSGMMLTTVVAEAGRMVKLENGPESFDMPLSAIKIGPVALIGIPGEPFTGIGLGLKSTEGFSLICPMCITNGYEGYFPMKDAYDEGGYEARSSRFKAGSAEYIIAEGQSLLKELNK